MTSKDDPFGDSTTKAVSLLFKKRLYLPVYPFKMIIQSMLHDEVAAESPDGEIEYVSIPEEKAFLSIKLAVFGESECVGARHLSKLLNSKSMQELKLVAALVKEAFNNPVTNFKTEKLSVDYVDVYHISSFLSQQIAQPRQHRVKMTVEIVVSSSSFEECLNVFLRRILEDATKSEKSLKILSSSLKAQTGENSVQDIQISTMKANRQQVLASLKAAVVNDGDIYLEFFLHRQRALLAYQSDAVSYREPSEGFVHIVRYYRLSFRNDKGEARCFSRYPVESVVLGIFQNANEAKVYTGAYKDHLQRISPTQTSSSGSASSGDAKNSENNSSDELSLHTFLGHWCEGVVTSWSEGELCNAAEEMILLHCLLAANRSDPTYCIKQLVHLTVSHMGHIRAVRDAILSLRNCVNTLVHCITHSSAVNNHAKGVALNEEESEYLDKLKHMFALLTPFVIQVKKLLLDLIRLQELHSELQYVSEYLTSVLWTMFDKTLQTHPIIAIDLEHSSFKKKSLLNVVSVLTTTASALNRLDESLKMVELSVGSEIYAAMIRQDLQSYALYMNHMKLTATQALKSRKETEIPKCFIDLLGYALAYKAHRHSVNAGNPATFLWKPLAVSESLAYQLLPDDRSKSEKEDRQQLLINIEDNLTLVKYLWEQYSLLGEYPILRHGGVDFLAAVQDELVRYDVPRFMAIEGAKIRYLSETHVIRALHEAYFFTSTMPKNRLHFPALCKELFKFPSFQQLWNGVEDASLEEDIFYPVRKNLLQITSNQARKKKQQLNLGIFGAYKIGLSNVPARLKNLIAGGVYGSDRVLSALGSNCESLFEVMWNLPPLLPSPANVSSVGIQMRMHCGLAVETALQWCTPDLNQLRADQAARKAQQDSENGEDNEEEETHAHLDKKSIFNSMFGRGSANASASAVPSSHQRHHHRQSQASPPDLDTGVLRPPVPLDLEIVFNAKCEYSENVTKVRTLFAGEVCRIVRFMLQHNTWNVENVIIHKEAELTADLGSKSGGLSKTFSHVELADDAHYQSFSVLEDTLKRFGSAVVEGSVLMPESQSRLKVNDLLAVFDGMTSEPEVTRENDEEPVVGVVAGGSSVNPPVAPNTEVPVAQTPSSTTAAAAPPAVSPKLIGKASTSMKKNEQVVASVKGFENAFSKRRFSPEDDDEDEEDQDDGASIDPTGRDSERLCADSEVSSQVQSHLNNAIKVYVPCRVHFTLVVQVASHNRWRGGGVRGGGGTAPVYSRITGHHDKALAVGNDHSIARLVASTLWFNPEAAGAIWSHVRDGETQCIYHEAVERWKAYHHCIKAGDFCRAYQHGLLSALLSQNYALCVPMYRACHALAFKLKRVIQVSSVCRQMLLQLSGYDVIALGMTVSRHICLAFRFLLMSPQCAHFRGGCSHILQLIAKLEDLLRLSPIPMKAGVTKLPNQLLDVVRYEKKAKDDFKIQIRYNNENYTEPVMPSNPQQAGANSNLTVLTDSYLDRQLNPSAPVGASVSGKARPRVMMVNPNSGEVNLRKALSRHSDIPDICQVLQSIEETSRLLLFAVSKDFHANFANVSHVLKEPPVMIPSRQMMDLVLGDDCDFASLLSFIQRAESTTNKQLEDPEYIANMESLQSIKSYKSLRDAVLSMEAVNILHQLAELSDSASNHEKASIASLVKSAIKSQDGNAESESRRNSGAAAVGLGLSASDASLATVNSAVSGGGAAGSVEGASSVVGSILSEGGSDAPAAGRSGPALAPKIRAIATLLKGFKAGAAGGAGSASSSVGGMTPSASAEKLQIETDDFSSIHSTEMGATFGSPCDAMQFTPDDSARARDLYKKLAFPPRSGNNKLRDAALKINLGRMFSLQEGDEESPERSARPLHGKGILSHFHDEDEAAYNALVIKQQLIEGSVPAVGSNVPTFSSSGFKLVGDSVKSAAEGKSMLQLLRVYSNVDQPVEPLVVNNEPRQRFFGMESEEEEEIKEERRPINTGSVLDTLRSMGNK